MLALFVEDSSSTTVAFAQTFKILSKFGDFMNEDFEGVLFLQKRAKNSHNHTDSLTGVGCRATTKAKQKLKVSF